MQREFLRKVQAHLAWTSVGPTTLRGMLEIGQRKKICLALAELPLKHLKSSNYCHLLDKWTEKIAENTGAPWGPVRKALNLFVRDVSYSFWLRGHSGIAKHENEMEVPLDGIVMGAIRENTENMQLVKCAVKALSQEISAAYQASASIIARGKGLHRVHLDLDWWADRKRP